MKENGEILSKTGDTVAFNGCKVFDELKNCLVDLCLIFFFSVLLGIYSCSSLITVVSTGYIYPARTVITAHLLCVPR